MQRRTAVMSQKGDREEEFSPFLENAVRNILVPAEDTVAQTVLTAILMWWVDPG